MPHNLTLQAKERQKWRFRWLRNLPKGTEIISGRIKRKTQNSRIEAQHTFCSLSLLPLCPYLSGTGGQGTSLLGPLHSGTASAITPSSPCLMLPAPCFPSCPGPLLLQPQRQKGHFVQSPVQEQTEADFTKSSTHLDENGLSNAPPNPHNTHPQNYSLHLSFCTSLAPCKIRRHSHLPKTSYLLIPLPKMLPFQSAAQHLYVQITVQPSKNIIFPSTKFSHLMQQG